MPEKRRFMDRTRDTWDSATEKLGEARDKTRDTIKEHPFTSVIVAAAIGAAVGIVTTEIIRAVRRSNRR
jgi:ElaB/YqjD/DUF883 family membrane-anchored ribosome-binding protein